MRNSSLVERSCAENKRASNHIPKPWDLLRSIEKARTSMVAVLEYTDPSLIPSKQQIKSKEKQEERINKGIELVVNNAGKIAETGIYII